jgi:hypothetical protein
MLELVVIKNRLKGEMESQTRDENPGHFNGVNCSIGKHAINIQLLVSQVNSICTGQ